MEVGLCGLHGAIAQQHVVLESSKEQDIAMPQLQKMVEKTVRERELKAKLAMKHLVKVIFFFFIFICLQVKCKRLIMKNVIIIVCLSLIETGNI